MVWVVDRGLIRLRDQVNAAAPDRSKASDGTIGDPAHQTQGSASDHNPEDASDAPGNPDEQVDALDLTHDPGSGADMAVITEAIRRSKDRRVSYVIFSRRIFSGPDGPMPFVWRTYYGTDPHTNHAHISVRDSTHDQTQDWEIGMALTGTEHIWLQANKTRLEALALGKKTYPRDWTTSTTDQETNWAITQLALIGPLGTALTNAATKVAELTNTVAQMKATVEEVAGLSVQVAELKAMVAELLARPPVVGGPVTGQVSVSGTLTVADVDE